MNHVRSDNVASEPLAIVVLVAMLLGVLLALYIGRRRDK